MKKVRVFVAIDLSAEAKKEVSKLYKVLQKKHWKARWEKIDKLHITLAFLGEIKDADRKSNIEKIKKAVKLASRGIKSFTISFKGLGCFPDYDYPRVIWLGLKGDLKSLAALQKNIIKQIEKSDFYNDLPERIKKGLRRPFSAHITMGRVKKAKARERREIGRQLKRFMIYDLQSRILVNRVIVYESKLSPAGSVYKKLVACFFPHNMR